MTFTGSVLEKAPIEGDSEHGSVTVSVRGANHLGDHVTGTVSLVLPMSLGVSA